MLLHKDTKASLLFAGFVLGTGGAAIGIFLMIRGDVADGAAAVAGSLSTSTICGWLRG